MADVPQQQPPSEPEIVFPAKFGRYTLLRRLGEGGMGEIFLASLQGGIAGVEKICVIKKLRRMFSHDDEFVARFLDEARLMVQLNHANIVPVFDAGTIDGDYFLAMELVDGIDLRELNGAAARRGETLNPAIALFIIREILGALAYAHKKADQKGVHLGLVHRDISPQNVLISVNGEVKLIDFGLAKSTQKVLKTDPRVVLGKYAYMSPEQARGQPVDGRSDLFAVGLLLFELIANRKLWDGITVGELMEQIAEHRVFSPGKIMKGVDPEIDALIDHALLKDVSKRFQTAEEFRDAVSKILSRLAPTISPDTLGAEVRRARQELAGKSGEISAPKPPQPLVDSDPTAEAPMEDARAGTQVVPRPTKSARGKAASTGTSTTETDIATQGPATWKLVVLGLGIGALVVGIGVGVYKLVLAPSSPPQKSAPAPVKKAEPEPAPAEETKAAPPATDEGDDGKSMEVAPAEKTEKAPAKKERSKPRPRKKIKKKK